MGKMCDKGCVGVFMKDKAYVLLDGRVILETPRRANKLWYLQPTPDPQPHSSTTPADAVQCNAITNVYQIRRLNEAMQFLHAALGSQSKSTLLRAARQGILPPWPLITPQNINNHLVETMATAKGHLQRVRKNVRSQASLQVGIKLNDDEFDVVQETKTNAVYLLVFDTFRFNGTAYTDLTGQFPYTSARGNRYIFFLYSYDSNAILMECMKSRADSEMKRVCEKSYARLEKRGIKPQFNVMDNEASNMICEWMEKNNIAYQKVPPDNHRANIAER
ncbi:hypothetical protein ACHAWF_002577 [Thalassiosira exigua]